MSELDKYLNSLFLRLEEAGECIPDYRAIYFVNNKEITRKRVEVSTKENRYGYICKAFIPKEAIFKQEDFATLFDKLLNMHYPWINISCAGVMDGALYFLVTLPGYTTRVPREHVFVNCSGPSIIDNKLVWDMDRFHEVV